MNPFSIQNHLPVYAIDAPLLHSIDNYINRHIPRILQLNIERGNERPLDVNVRVAIRKAGYTLQFGSVSNSLAECFSEDVHEVVIELAHDNRFNFNGRRIIVLIINFDIVNSRCHISLALNGKDAKQSGMKIYNDLKAILLHQREPALN